MRHVVLCFVVSLMCCVAAAATPDTDVVIHGTFVLPTGNDFSFTMFHRSTLTVTAPGEDPVVYEFTPELSWVQELGKKDKTPVISWTIARKSVRSDNYLAKIGQQLKTLHDNQLFRATVDTVELTRELTLSMSPEKHQVAGWTVEWSHVNH